MYHRQLFASGETIREQKDEIARLQAENELLRGYRDEAEAEASIASLAAQRLRLTDAEREAVRFALNSLDWPLDGTQLAVVARTVGASCKVPEHRMKATLRGLLERMTP